MHHPVKSLPLISVVLPVRYVHEDWLRQSIESVLNQDYPNKELIVVNDETTQDIDGLIQEYGIRKYIKNDRNRKLPYSLNRGFEQAEGELHTWTSSDNYMLPGMLSRLSRPLIDHPEISIIFGSYKYANDAGILEGDCRASFRAACRQANINPVDFVIPGRWTYFATLGAAFLYRRAVFETLSGYNERLHGAEDYDFWIRASSSFRIAHLSLEEEPLYVYRLHEHSISNTTPGCFTTSRLKVLARQFLRQPGQWLLAKSFAVYSRLLLMSSIRQICHRLLKMLKRSGPQTKHLNR